MDIKEITQMLVKSSENFNGSKFVPWWDGEDEDGTYRYEIIKAADVAEIDRVIAETPLDVISSPVGTYKHTLFHLLVWHNFYDTVKALIARKIDVNVVDGGGKGFTPLMLACYRTNYKMAKLLIDSGADVNRVNAEGRTCWHFLAGLRTLLAINPHSEDSSRDQRKPIATLLGDNFDVADAEGKTALATVICRNNNEASCALIDILLGKGARTDYKDEHGETLLTLAIKNNHNTAALRLASVKSLVNEPNANGELPLKIADNFRKEALCMELKANGAAGETQFSPRMKLSEFERITSNGFAFSDGYDRLAPALYLAQKLISVVDEDDDDEVECIADILYNALGMDEDCTVLDMIVKAGISLTAKFGSRGRVWCLRDKCFTQRAGVKAIKKLVSLGVDINSAIIDGKTPVHIIASQSVPYSIRGEKITYFEDAARLFDPQSATALDNGGVSALHTAALMGHADMIRVLVENGADVNVTQDSPAKAGNTPLHSACERYKADVVKTLLELGADDSVKNVDGETPAHFIAKKITFGFSTNDRDRAEKNRPIILGMLKAVDEQRNDGMTPLMIVQDDNRGFVEQATQILLDKGVDVNRTDNRGRTALIIAADRSCDKDAIKALFFAGADIDVADKTGRTALHYALMYGDEDVARYLIKKGADYNRPDNNGTTAATLAAEKGCETVLELMTDIS